MNKFIGFLILILAFVSCKDDANTIKVKLNKKVEGEAYIFPVGKRGAEKKEIVKQKITSDAFSINLVDTGLYSLQINNSKIEVYFVFENKAMNIIVDVDDPINSVAKGGELNKRYKDYESTTYDFIVEKSELRNKYKDTKDKDLVAEFIVKNKEIEDKTLSFKEKFVTDNNNIIGAYVLFAQKHAFSKEFMEESYNAFSGATKSTFWGKATLQLLTAMENTKVGNKYVNISSPDITGKKISISDYLNKDKYVAVYFWASWCSTCKKANPKVVDLYSTYKDKLEIVAISLDEDKDKWTKYVLENNFTWPHMSDLKRFNTPAVDEYAVVSIPHMVLLDSEGTIIAKSSNVEDIENALSNI